MLFHRLLLLFALCCWLDNLWAQSTSCLAPVPDYKVDAQIVGKEVLVMADSSQVKQNHFLSFNGNVSISSKDAQISANRAEIDKLNGQLVANGDVAFSSPEIRVKSGSVSLNTLSGKLDLQDTHYRLLAFEGRGKAQRIMLDKNEGIDLHNVKFTTCPEGGEDWLMQASSIELERGQVWGKAQDVKFYIGGVPVLYLPYFSFPVTDQRQTGFLLPELGSSSSVGISLEQPYYWNLAPNYDLTIAPRILSKRGVQLKGQFRYLTHFHQGQVNLEFLPSDGNTTPRRDRYFYRWNHRGMVFDDWLLTIDYSNISDDNYIVDLGNDFYGRADTHLYQTLGLSYFSEELDISFKMRGFEVVGNHPSSYRAFPEARLRYETEALPGVEFRLDSELAYFDNTFADKPNALRWHFAPTIALPYRRTWGEFVAEATLLNTYYKQNNISGTELNKEVNRSLGQARLFGTLHYERKSNLFGNAVTQTLEPKFQYLYTSYTDQQNIGFYDTTPLLTDFAGLFRGQEFTGLDRISDNNQITVGLTSRILDKNDREQFSVSLGQIFYLSDNRLIGADKGANRSALASELDWRISSKWFVHSELQLSTQTDKIERSGMLLEYNYDDKRLVQFSHRYVRDISGEKIDQLGITTAWPLAKNWRWVGRWYKDTERHRTIETYAGVQYQSCCWTLGLVGQRRLINRFDALGGQSTEQFDSGIKLVFSFTGMGTGNRKRRMLEDGLFGYRQPYLFY